MIAAMDDYDISACERLFKKTVVHENGCWYYTGRCNPLWDQGQFWYRGKQRIASRIAYLLTKDDIPDDLCVLHTCDNPSCINPEHLFLGTNQDNTTDKINKGRGLDRENHPLTRLTEDDVENIRFKIQYVSQSVLAKEYNMSKSAIKHIVMNRSWKNDPTYHMNRKKPKP